MSCAVEEKEAESADLERLCQGLSANDQGDGALRDVHRWFCDAHAEDEHWHPSMLPLGEEGAEA